MADNYLEKQYEQYEARKAAWEKARKHVPKKPHVSPKPDIERYTGTDYDELIQVWDASVRSSHAFLTEADIQAFKPLIRQEYFPAVTLYVIRNEARHIAAFMGLSDTLIEMLFVHPDEQEKGYGKCLIEFAVRQKHIRKVDVNEQNEKAYRFYLRRGFKVTSRSETDGMGKPFPILHMDYEDAMH